MRKQWLAALGDFEAASPYARRGMWFQVLTAKHENVDGCTNAEVCPKHPILAPTCVCHYQRLKILLLALGPAPSQGVYISGAVVASVTSKPISMVERRFSGAIIDFLPPNIGSADKTIYVKF